MTTNQLPRSVFVALSIAIVAQGCGLRDSGVRRESGQTSQGAARTVRAVKAPDGVEIRYESSGRGEPTLVFVHGWSCDRSYWRSQIDHFAATHRVVALDLGGHGESGFGRDEWTVSAFGGDVRAVLDALGPQPVILVGHSMGGPIILEVERLVPERVTALVVVDFLHDVDQPMGATEREAFIGALRADFSGTTEGWVRRELFTARSDAEVVNRIARDMAAGAPTVGVSAMEHLIRYDQAAGLAATAAPVRLINADAWPTDFGAIRRQKPDAGLAVMPEVGHFLMIEDAEEFNRLLERAVRELADDSRRKGR